MKKQEGHNLAIIFLAILVACGIGITCWYVWQSRSTNKTEETSVHNSTEPASDNEKSRIEPIPGGTGYFDMAKLAKTDEQREVAAAIRSYCLSLNWPGVDEEHTLVGVSQDTFSNDHLYRTTGTNVSVAAACYSTAQKVENQATGREYLLHKEDDKWVVDLATQMVPQCSTVDNLGYSKILPECVIDGTQGETRLPR